VISQGTLASYEPGRTTGGNLVRPRTVESWVLRTAAAFLLLSIFG